MTKPVTISLSLDAGMAAAIEARARTMGKRMSEYVRQLIDAAYAARIAIDRGDESGDTKLDRHVRQVFLLADCEPEYIAAALAIPEARVRRIIDAWRSVAFTLDASAPLALPAPEAETTIDRTVRAGDQAEARPGFTPQQGAEIGRLWREGRNAAQIGAAMGTDADTIRQFAKANRDLCPARPNTAVAKNAGQRGAMSAEHVETIARLWAEGLPTRDVAAAIGKSEGALSVWAVKNRDICPKRRA